MTLIGTTFSHSRARYLGLDPIQTYTDLLKSKFHIIRLCLYWNEVEPVKGNFNYASIRTFLEMSEYANQKVIVTVGMKAPRWPEFYIPKWIQDKPLEEIEGETLYFIQKSINELKKYTCIKYWQIENEPLDPSGPDDLSIPLALLQNEVENVRAIDDREVMLTMWGNQLTRRKHFDNLLTLTNNIGIDLYYKVPQKNIIGKTVYKGPHDSDEKLIHATSHCNDLWITELQAEPWEEHQVVKLDTNTPSFDLQKMKDNLRRARNLDPKVILLWGSEYWFWRAKHGDNSYIEFVREIIQS